MIDFRPLDLLGLDSSCSLRILLRKSLIWTSGAPWSGQLNFIKDSIEKNIDLNFCRSVLRLLNYLKDSIKKSMLSSRAMPSPAKFALEQNLHGRGYMLHHPGATPRATHVCHNVAS